MKSPRRHRLAVILNRWHEQFRHETTLDNRSGAKPRINGHTEKGAHTDSGDGGRRYSWRQ